MLRTLNLLGISVAAIEQPLDLTVPENLLTLAIYLAVPEVDNARRSLNIKQSLRRAKKEGRCPGLAPIGYVNKCTENGVKYITAVKPLANVIRVAFEQIAARTHNMTQAYQYAVNNEFPKSKNCFWRAIRNPLYCGKILIPAAENEIERYAQGLHNPIVSETVFFKVQQIINCKKEKHHKRLDNEQLLPLRGFLVCKDCGKVMTGSGSQGRNQKYYYYHCHSHCRSRLRADTIHQLVFEGLQSFNLVEDYIPICQRILKQTLTNAQHLKTQTSTHLTKRIDELTNRINRSRELLLQGDIDGSDYKKIKTECETDINILREKRSMQLLKSKQHSKDLGDGLVMFSKLHWIYDEGDTQTKKMLTTLIFRDYLVSDGISIHRATLNNVMNILYEQEVAFTGAFSFNNHPARKLTLTRGEEELNVDSEHCKRLRKIRLLRGSITVKELRDTIEFIQILSQCITDIIIK